jgi:hypothetical protein
VCLCKLSLVGQYAAAACIVQVTNTSPTTANTQLDGIQLTLLVWLALVGS